MTDKLLTRTQVNQMIHDYWVNYKKTHDFKPLKKAKVKSFTRHNGSRLNRLKNSGWRYPKSSQGNRTRIAKPSIGLKRPESKRFKLPAYGMAIGVICNHKDLELVVKSSKLPVISRTLGVLKRLEILNVCKEKDWPLLWRR